MKVTRTRRLVAPATILLMLSAACLEGGSSDDEHIYTLGRGGRAALRAITDCPDLEQSFKDQMAARMQEELEQNRQNALDWAVNQEEYCNCWWGDSGGDSDGTTYDCAGMYEDGDAMGGTGGTPPPSNSGGGSDPGTREEASDYSTTNTQVDGVDEADFIKNDGSFIYLVSGDQFQIIEAWPAPDSTVIASVGVEGFPQRMFVAADRAVIYSDVGEGQTCVYDPYYGSTTAGGALKITVFDISDRANPVLEREIRLSGSYANSRRVGPGVHTVVTFPESFELSLPTQPDGIYWWDCDTERTEAEINDLFDALLADNLAIIDAADLGDFLPSAEDTDYLADGSSVVTNGLFIDCENFYEPSSTGNPGFLSVVSFPIDDDTQLGAATIFGRGGEVYASHDNLYVAVKENVDAGGNYGWGAERTLVHKFAIDAEGSAPDYRASGEVAGRILNQFAMDEYEGRLRIATTEGHLPDPDTTNNVFVLEEKMAMIVDDNSGDCGAYSAEGGCLVTDGPVLEQIGAIRDIARTEDIRSVRFDGPRGFMVTFKKTDPLFAFDLTDPANPTIEGELKIPGFSTYMHFLDENHLLTIGFDADDQGSFAWFTGVMLQIFDVSDMTAPALIHKEIIGTRGSTSDATDDHMAFNYFKSRELLAIPMGICEEAGGGGSYGSSMTFNGLLVYKVTATDGFTLLGGVDHRDPTVGQYDCYNWWSSPNSQVKRSVFMEDYVFSISPEKMKVNHLPTLDTDLVSIGLPQGDTPQDPYCYDW